MHNADSNHKLDKNSHGIRTSAAIKLNLTTSDVENVTALNHNKWTRFIIKNPINQNEKKKGGGVTPTRMLLNVCVC